MPAAFFIGAVFYAAIAAGGRHMGAILVGVLLLGLVNHLQVNLLVTRLGETVPKSKGAVLGLNTAVTYVGATVGTATFAPLYSNWGFRATAIASALLMLAAVLFSLMHGTKSVLSGTGTTGGAMAKRVLFVQGGGKDVHAMWDRALVESLRRGLGTGYTVHYPRMPDEGDPHFATWKAALQQEFASLHDGDILVGHSIGATILLYTVVVAPPAVIPGALILLSAPFIGRGGWRSEDMKPRTDFSEHLPAGMPVRIYQGTKDKDVPFAHAELYAKAIPSAVVVPIENANHQLDDNLIRVAHDIRALKEA